MAYPKKTTLAAERANELLSYDPVTGRIAWKVSPSNFIKAGRSAGCLTNFGYLSVIVDGQSYVAHRLAWLMQTGDWPPEEIDHINGVRDDNRWCNLRAATPKQNRENRGKAPSNTSGIRGVSWVASRGNWLAQIKHHGINRNLGRFPCLLDAAAKRISAERQLFTHHRAET